MTDIKEHWEHVSEEKFFQYINDYPRSLDVSLNIIWDPPLKRWYDVTGGFFVAKHSIYSGLDRMGPPDNYHILTNYQGVYNEKINARKPSENKYKARTVCCPNCGTKYVWLYIEDHGLWHNCPECGIAFL
ncbi:MAG: hypothetical protein J6S67_07425 [Methanobrevibacter sp.]|nr:hypothetical protein [Methanobrevibacter sp.]